ncbi:MAG TPA: hypothetical protein VJ579_04310 [Candidatus Paceibacterota bacterium]|nr:hypothetical protein [Candidatus Paceibacterota bacterium]
MNTHSHKATQQLFALFFGFLMLPIFAFAASFEVTPKVIDVKGKVREISHHNLTLKATGAGVSTLYVWVVDVDQVKGDLAKSDMSGINANSLDASPSRWIEIPRSINLLPKEEQTVPFQMQIPARARPGNYHVALKFASGQTQFDAQKCESCTEQVLMNIEVTEDIREKLQLFSFTAAKNIFVRPSAEFSFAVENTGNRALVPNGKIRIFDNTGKEVGLVDVNADGKQVEPKGKELLAASWAAGGHFGKYKAMLDMSYGQRGTMQDVVYFWVIPWSKMLGFGFTLIVLMVLFMLFARGRDLARPQYAYAEAVEPTPAQEAESQVEENEIREGMLSRIARRFRRNGNRLEDVINESELSSLTEVNIPVRTRTVPPAHYSVQLEQKVRVVPENHIVRLR